MAYKPSVNLDYYDLLKYSKSELQEMLRVRTKRSNQRLCQLETSGKANQSNAYRYVEKTQGKARFSGKTKGMSKNQLASKVHELNEFLESKTSTVKGVKHAYQNSYDTVVERYGKGVLSADDFRRIYESSNWESFKKNYYSAFKGMLEKMDENTSINDILQVIESTVSADIQDIQDLQNIWQETGNIPWTE